MIVGIIGNGFVGKATFQLMCKDINVMAYDIQPDLCIPRGLVLADMNRCEILFVSVPTPMSRDGSCHLAIVESVLRDLASIDYRGSIVLRSTVPVGTCDRLNCYFMPEFLTEKNYLDDFVNTKEWIFGLMGAPDDAIMKEKIRSLFTLAYNHGRIKHNCVHFVANREAEMIKMFKNCYLATKVSFCNEIYQFCQQKQVDYEAVRVLACVDERIAPSHTRVPGPDGQRGFGGTCFPKDTSSLRFEMQQAGMTSYILNAVVERNEVVDRPQKDWLLDEGRAAIDK